MIGSLIGGIIGENSARHDKEDARAAIEAALAEYKKIEVPSVDQQKVMYNMLQSVGEFHPELIDQLPDLKNAMNDIRVDPRLKDAQMGALNKMRDIANTGRSAAGRSALESQLNDAATRNRGQQGAIMANMAARGMGGGGAELAARMAANQENNDSSRMAALKIAADEEAAARSALASSGELASRYADQDFGQQAQMKSSSNAINQFNQNMRSNTNNINTGLKNSSNMYNLQNKQRIADTNVGTANAQEEHNKGLYQTNFNNQITRANGMAGQYGNVAAMHNADAAATQNKWSNFGGAFDKVVGATAGALAGGPAGAQAGSNMADSSSVDMSGADARDEDAYGKKPTKGFDWSTLFKGLSS